ncbi:MAG: hypothetical protein P1U57_03855 [Oleibacter sp.]|nr:hypothetical protein [Thalassolituus sp.]
MHRPTHPVIIDVEASGFGSQSYPIEVGYVMSEGDRFCSLITPQDDWTHWSKDAECVHGIRRESLLKAGRSATEVALVLNSQLAGMTVYSDGWVVDKPWITKLFAASGMAMTFNLSSIEMIMTEEQILIWDQTKIDVINSSKLERHRASNDAWIIQETYRRTLLKTKPVNDSI